MISEALGKLGVGKAIVVAHSWSGRWAYASRSIILSASPASSCWHRWPILGPAASADTTMSSLRR